MLVPATVNERVGVLTRYPVLSKTCSVQSRPRGHLVTPGVINVATPHLTMIPANLTRQFYGIKHVPLLFAQPQNALVSSLTRYFLPFEHLLHFPGDFFFVLEEPLIAAEPYFFFLNHDPFLTGQLDELLVEIDLHLFVAYGLFEFGDALLHLCKLAALRFMVYHKYGSFFYCRLNSGESSYRYLYLKPDIRAMRPLH